jgi:hypothetical protein
VILALTLSLSLLASSVDVTAYEVDPRPIAWSEVSPDRFDLARRLPAKRTTPGRDLLAEMERLVALRFEVDHPTSGVLRCFGDIVAAVRPLESPARIRWFEDLRSVAPKLSSDWASGMTELLYDYRLRKNKWSPKESHARDGILNAEAWDLSAEGAPWDSFEVDAIAEQAAVLMFADRAAIKAAENDFVSYPDNIDEEYEAIYPRRESYRRGSDPSGNPFAVVGLYFRCDLPFPYSDYECDLRMLTSIDAQGRLVTDIESPSSDFHWFAGRDVYLPVETSAGRRVAYLVVRQYGFDLDGVPDGRDQRIAALQGSLGNLKLNSERRFGRDREIEDADGVLPEFRVLGAR